MKLRFVETAYQRNVLFAVELLDAVTLERVNQGIRVDAQGLRRKPVYNSGGLFVWTKQTPQEDTTALRSLAIDTGELPYQSAMFDSSQVQARKLTTITLAPRVNYPFQAGVTGLRGTLIESNFGAWRPVLDGSVRLQWIDHASNWIDSPPVSKTETDKGDFVAILRFLPNAKPDLNTDGTIQVRLQADRPTAIARYSTPFKLTPGRLSDPVQFAWDELNP
jgi:hypothetical protein